MSRKSRRQNHYVRLGYRQSGHCWDDILTCPVCSTISPDKICARLFMHITKHLRAYGYWLINQADDAILGIAVLTASPTGELA